jgi:serine protease AprX
LFLPQNVLSESKRRALILSGVLGRLPFRGVNGEPTVDTIQGRESKVEDRPKVDGRKGRGITWGGKGRRYAAAGVMAAAVAAVGLPARPSQQQPEWPTAAHASESSQETMFLGGSDGTAWRADKDLGSLYKTARSYDINWIWNNQDAQKRRVTGKGVGVALVDSGVAPVQGLDNVVNGPDLSFESQSPELRNLDTFGHGTHMAGIIAGRDPDVIAGHEDDPNKFVGIAPDATLVSVKVAGSDGATDVSQVIAGIDWAVQHRNDPGLNIRVLNLSFGTHSTQSYLTDPLAYAVESAWRNGIVVVVSAGNDGNTTDQLTDPAIDPFVISVGAVDNQGTDTRSDDVMATFSNRGSALRPPDVVAPGRSLVSLRDPGSSIDQSYPTARVADANGDVRFFRGSGTSQAAAFVSGEVALLLQKHPEFTPDQVKAALKATADPIANTDTRLQGAGLIDPRGANDLSYTPTWINPAPFGTGLGSLEEARGGSHVADPATGDELTGEQDIFGQTWDGRSWATASLAGRTWAGGTWNGSTWTGSSWSGRTWASADWAGRSWAGVSWAGRTWADAYWTGRSWAGRTWADAIWSDAIFAGRTWAGRTWAGGVW